MEKEIQTEEVKRRRGRVYGRQETEEQKEEDTAIKSGKIHLILVLKIHIYVISYERALC